MDPWYQEYDEGTHKSLEQFKTPQDLAAAYISTKAMVGNSIRVPGVDAGEEDQKAFLDSIIEKAPTLMLKPNLEDQKEADEYFKMLGRPDEADKYSADVPDGVAVDEERVKFLKGLSFDAGLSAKQFKSVMENVYAEDKKQAEIAKSAYDESIAELKKEWGSAYDKKSAESIAFAIQYFGDLFDKDSVPAEFSRGLDKIVAQLGSEDINVADPNAYKTMTPLEAQTAINEIYANAKHPYFIQTDIQHKAAMNRMLELQAFANPEDKK